MAHLHVHRTVYKAGSRKARNRIEYITRQPATVTALQRKPQPIRYIAGQREDLVYANVRNLPAWAQSTHYPRGNPHAYFTAAEDYEGRQAAQTKKQRGVSYEEWKVTLPRELSTRQNLALTKDIVDAMTGKDLPVVYALHAPDDIDGSRQPHLHILISTRKTDMVARTPQQHFRRYNPQDPRKGGAQKDHAYYHKGMVKAWRDTLSDITNIHLEACGHQARVSSETLMKQGIKRQPEPKLKPSQSAEHKKGIIGSAVKTVLDIRAKRDRQQELLITQTAWNSRKAQLGITAEMTTAERIQIARDARQALVAQTPAQAQALRLVLKMNERQASYEAYLQRKQEERQNERRHSQYWQEQASIKRGLDPTGRIFDRGHGR